MTKTIRAIATVLVLAACGITPSVIHAPHRPVHTCQAQILPFEDGSWLGKDLVYDGKVVMHRWDNRMPQTGWKPGWKGTPCTLTIVA